MLQVFLTVDLVNAILGYLGSRPFVEVANLIQGIHDQANPQFPKPEVAQPEAPTDGEANG
jgi:hypothetical protein